MNLTTAFNKTLMDPEWLRDNAKTVVKVEGPAWSGFDVTVEEEKRVVEYRLRIGSGYRLRLDVYVGRVPLAYNNDAEGDILDFFRDLDDLAFRRKNEAHELLEEQVHEWIKVLGEDV